MKGKDFYLTGGVAYTNAEWGDFPGAPCAGGQSAAQGCIGGVQDLTGKPLPFAPKWAFNIGALAEVEAHGFSTSFGHWRREIYAVGAPVWLDRGDTVLALNCGTRRRDLDKAVFHRELGPALMAMSSEISHRMDQLGASFWNE